MSDLSANPKLLIVEDDPRVRDTITAALCGCGYDIMHTGSLAEARAALVNQLPDIVVVDLSLPDGRGEQLLVELAQGQRSIPALVLTMSADRQHVLGALRAGACGYLLKEDLVVRLDVSLQEALAGGMPISSKAARFVRDLLQTTGRHAGPQPTQREREMLECFARGLSYEQAATDLGISLNTVRAHVRNLYDKLAVTNRAEAVFLAVQEGWIARA